MSVAAVRGPAQRTNAEQAMARHFAAVESRLPGSAHVKAERRQAMAAFAANGLPHRRLEPWKYTDLRNLVREAYAPAVPAAAPLTRDTVAAIESALGPLAALDAHRIVLVDGQMQPALSALDGRCRVAALRDWLETSSDAGAGAGAPTSVETTAQLNTAFMTDGAVVTIAPGAVLDRPLLVVHARTGREPAAITTRNIVQVGHGAKVELIEAFVAIAGASAETQINALTEVALADHAALAHVLVMQEGAGAQAVLGRNVTVGAAARYRAFQLAVGAGLTRVDMAVVLAGAKSSLDVSGALLARDGAHVDTTLVVDHQAPGCESRELFKAVLDTGARAVFQGKIIVRQAAQKTDGKQMAQALLLAPDTEFDSKPELEIYADDVACGHGSTVAEIDADQVFYLRARGIPEHLARTLLIDAFVVEAIDKVENAAVRDALADMAASWLGREPTSILEQGRGA